MEYDTDMAGEITGEGKIEGFARKNIKKSLFLLGGLAVASILLPPVGAAVASGLAAGSGVEALGSKFVHGHLKHNRLNGGH
jgi:hypothetical protein